MTINEFIEILKEHNVDFDKDLAVAPNEDADGDDFSIEESELCVFLVVKEWGDAIHHSFMKGSDEK